jgi:hypothetical protein
MLENFLQAAHDLRWWIAAVIVVFAVALIAERRHLSRQPRYVHDCDGCTFLGQFEEYDLYACDNTVIARRSDEGSDYKSGLVFGITRVDAHLAEALDRATARGITITR